MEYWKESLSSAAEECGVIMTDEQLAFMAEAMHGSHENYGLYTGYNSIICSIESQAQKELEELKRSIAKKKRGYNLLNHAKHASHLAQLQMDGAGRRIALIVAVKEGYND